MTPEVVGREDELAVIARSLGDTERPGLLVIEGEAGIGKTTLWQAGLAAARDRGYALLAARPARAEARLAFAGLADLLSDHAPALLRELPAPQRRALEVALLLSEASGMSPEPRAISVAFLSALRVLSARRPALLAVDDVQWVDEPSARVLAFALRRRVQERVAVLLTRRVDARPDGETDLDRALRDAGAATLHVGPLSLGAIHRLLRDRLGLILPRPTLHQVQTAAAGNPFLALEIARAIKRRGGRLEPGEPLPVPTGLDDLVGERIAALPDETREALLVAASLREPTLAACSAALRVSDLASRLRPAIAAQVIEVEGERLRFSHPLLAAVAYSQADGLQRRSVHRRLAETAPTLEERARHLALSGAGPGEGLAAALEDAGRDALARGALESAIELLEQAAAASPPEDVDGWARRALVAADAHARAGDAQRGIAVVRSVVDRLPSGTRRAEAFVWLAERELSLDHAARALLEAGSDAELQARAWNARAENAFIRGDVRDALASARRGLDAARTSGRRSVLVRSLAHCGLLEAISGAAAGHGLLVEACDLADDAVETVYFGPRAALANERMWADDLETARDLFLGQKELAIEAGDEYAHEGLLLRLTEVEQRAGRWDIARTYAEAAADINEQSGGAQRGAFLWARSLMDAHLGDLDRARRDAARALELSEEIGDRLYGMRSRIVLGFCELSAGEAEAALKWYAPLRRSLDEMGILHPGVFAFDADEVEAAIDAGELEHARERVSWLERTAAAFDQPRSRVLAARGRALLAAARGELDTAAAALAEDEPLPVPFERARTLLVLGRVHRRADRRRAARGALEAALGLFEQLGARLWAQKTRAELARIGGRVAQALLTATEQQVAELVAEGRTNQEVAAALVVSRRAVEANLTRIYEKLGVRSRVELTRRMAEGRAKPGA